ncbi:MAG TPA: bifunctional phosphoribosylaminoimidazolecarboxamide formyltransferase/IMP cyclohydrolase [Chloroflexota bacterium]|nr:bifunctional phosphoribosylaminoimidazolecarboxamide formyltransferase/IMP cyclohydrolase [Chloroflexota bacterium]
MRAIVSVFNKTGVVDFARGLSELGVEILSTGGTQTTLSEAGIPVSAVSDVTGYPEILGGRVKTLHPSIHGGILARRQEAAHMQELKKHRIKPVDMVVVNLYPFAETARRQGATPEDVMEMIDIGGPTMIRAAAKNYQDVIVVVDPDDYTMVLNELRGASGVSEATRRALAVKAFEHTAFYDAQIANYLRPDTEMFPDELTVPLKKMQELRYGENPHQAAAFYVDATSRRLPPGVATAQQLHGKQLSFNNSFDLDNAWSIVTDFAAPAVAIVKHGNPCGLACAGTVTEAFRKALATDPKAAYGGAIGVNRVVDEATAQEISQIFFEDMIAPGYTQGALDILQTRRNLRVMAVGEDWDSVRQDVVGIPALDFKRVLGGFLVQERDRNGETSFPTDVVTKREPTLDELTDLLFAWHAVKHVRSNAIVLAKKLSVVGVGAGQMSRVDSVELAIKKAGDRAKGSVMASDAYFPFPDGVEVAADAGVTAIIQPGGSIRDQDVIRAANSAQMAMIFTYRRHFKH